MKNKHPRNGSRSGSDTEVTRKAKQACGRTILANANEPNEAVTRDIWAQNNLEKGLLVSGAFSFTFLVSPMDRVVIFFVICAA